MFNEDALLLDVGDMEGVLRERGVSSVPSVGSVSTLSWRVSHVTRNDILAIQYCKPEGCGRTWGNVLGD
jgi:hypothetical protein